MGAGGMLGTDLTRAARARPGLDVVPLTRAALDVTDAGAVVATLRAHRPAVVVNCAAWTAVDDAETREKEAAELNATAVGLLAQTAAELGARLIQPSTDYVFPGTARTPYGVDAPTGPLSAYGRTKLDGERAALRHGHHVVRTAWLYGEAGRSFPRTMAHLEATRDTVDVVDDQLGQPTWTADLAEALLDLGCSGADPGVHHLTNTGQTSWYGLAREVFALLGADPDRVRPVGSAAFVRPAPRPSYSVLEPSRPLRGWREALHAAWPELSRAWSARVVGQAVRMGGE
ncbi:MAG: dTDP-4-dehydrorhamnose reductase [Nonomuraea sp.]|nr:dTDP-4-dehydrorhamnose reductase [Nonomuraea sp.]